MLTRTTRIKGATSATYTPDSDDDGTCLLVMAEYVDGFYDTADMMFDKSLPFLLPGQVQGSSMNMAPEFDGRTAMRYVPEDAAMEAMVGKPVVAKDPDDTVSYMLSGRDAGSFGVGLETGQITVTEDAELDHETKPTHTVTVTATDSHNESAAITVTIHVTDADEAPAAMEYMHIVDYPEKDTDPVITLTATDPEGASPIVWSLLTTDQGIQDIDGDGTDDDVEAADIADRALFDPPADGELNFKDAPNYEGAGDNEYHVVVQASDGTKMSWFKVTVMVMDLEEEGSITLRPGIQNGQPPLQESATLLQPQVGVGITADDLMDPDGSGADTRGISEISDADYQWYRTSSTTVTGTKIQIAGNDATGATYTRRPRRVTATLASISGWLRPTPTEEAATRPPRRFRNTRRSARTLTTRPPEFSATRTARAIPEEMPKGTAIGNPVTATDSDRAEVLTYWLSGGADAERYDINPRTGQLEVKEKVNYDTATPTTSHTVIVSAADSSGVATAMVTVTITITNVDEKPISFTGATTIEHEEGTTALMFDDAAVTYAAMDPEGGVVTLTLSGDDGDKFKLNDHDDNDVTALALEFKEKPDFENPGDMNDDNVYEITVVASDGANPATRDVTVKVTNIEETGEIEVTPAQPRIGTELTAELTDSDGVVSGPTWQWHKQDAETCPVATAESWDADADPDTRIKGATSATYTPDSDDDGTCLLVMAEYVDGFYDDNMMFDRSLPFLLPGKVQGSSDNMAPEFDGTTAMRYVPENVQDMNVGLPVVAKDPNKDTLGYMLSGADAGSFKIDLMGQIMVGANAELDHESKPTHMVTVTATDPHNASDTITVTIHVTDVDEAPEIFEGSLKVEGLSSVEYAEIRTDAVAIYMARGTNADSARWSLSGDDMRAFTISGGMLRFRASPDYENPMDMDGDNTYMVTVEANVVGNNAAMRDGYRHRNQRDRTWNPYGNGQRRRLRGERHERRWDLHGEWVG